MSPPPPFRADHVGSLLRPAVLHATRAQAKAGAIAPGELHAVEDALIRQAVAKQEGLGLRLVTDGEYRRDFWHLDFLRQLDGVGLTAPVGMTFKAEDVPPMATVTGPIRCTRPIMADDFAFLKSVARTATPKLTIPSPAMLHLRGGRNAIARDVYPDLAQFWADAGVAYRTAIGHIAAAGCTYLQVDDVSWAYLCDPKVRDNFRANGDDPGPLHRVYADAVVEAMFSIPVDAYFMEWDTERAGGFEPLRLLPGDKTVVLGLVTTKSGALESKDALRQRIDEAAKFVPLERLCLSPQCGFASTHHGNTLTEDEQWRKLERVVEVARDVWGG